MQNDATPVLDEATRIQSYRASATLAVDYAMRQALWAREHADQAKWQIKQVAKPTALMQHNADVACRAADQAWKWYEKAQGGHDRAMRDMDEGYILGATRAATQGHHLAGVAQHQACRHTTLLTEMCEQIKEGL